MPPHVCKTRSARVDGRMFFVSFDSKKKMIRCFCIVNVQGVLLFPQIGDNLESAISKDERYLQLHMTALFVV